MKKRVYISEHEGKQCFIYSLNKNGFVLLTKDKMYLAWRKCPIKNRKFMIVEGEFIKSEGEFISMSIRDANSIIHGVSSENLGLNLEYFRCSLYSTIIAHKKRQGA